MPIEAAVNSANEAQKQTASSVFLASENPLKFWPISKYFPSDTLQETSPRELIWKLENIAQGI